MNPSGRRVGSGTAALCALVATVALAMLVGHLITLASVRGPESGSTATGLPSTATEGNREHEPVPDDASKPAPGTATLGPSGRPSGREALVSNPLYDTDRLAPLPCPAPEVDVSDPAAMEAFLHVIADCLDDAWTTQFARAGIPFEPPERVFWTEPGTSPCRDYPSDAGAFYCRASESIYLGPSDVVEKWGGAPHGVLYASLLAHEYGHHVQGEAGLLDYYHERRRQEDGPVDRNAWTRRGELQANCLSGVFLGAVSAGYPISPAEREIVLDDAAATADRSDDPADRTHGSPRNSVLWTERGLTEQEPGACNTWSADPALVR